MKKYFIVLILVIFFVVGCGNDTNINNLDIEGASKSIDKEFTNMAAIDDTQLKVIYGLNVELLSNYSIKSSYLNNGNFYALIKVEEKNKKEVQNQMQKMFGIMSEQSNLYSPEAVDLINNRLETSVGDYLIYIISNDNDKYYDILKGYIK